MPEPAQPLPTQVRLDLKPVLSAAADLRRLAAAFDELGNLPVYYRLTVLAEDLEKAEADAVASANRYFDQWFKEVQQSSVNVIKGVLAGHDIGSRSQAKPGCAPLKVW